jgi:hypothetical protein
VEGGHAGRGEEEGWQGLDLDGEALRSRLDFLWYLVRGELRYLSGCVF